MQKKTRALSIPVIVALLLLLPLAASAQPNGMGLGGNHSRVTSIDGQGRVQGKPALSLLNTLPWAEADGFQDLGTLSGTNSFAAGINDQGHVR